MKKDITIPKVEHVYVAAVQEFNQDFNTYDWNVFIINDGLEPLETVLIVSQGISENKKTSLMRHSLKLLPIKSYAKVEFLEDSVLSLANYFTVTYFIGDTLYDKKFEFPSESILLDNAVALPIMDTMGVLAR